MIVLDAYAVIAYLRGETAAPHVADLLREPTMMSAVNVAEVFDQLVRIDQSDPDEVEIRLATLEAGGMKIAPASAADGIEAGRLRGRHYRKNQREVSLADCFAAVTALGDDGPTEHTLATADPALLALMNDEGGATYPLPTRGRT